MVMWDQNNQAVAEIDGNTGDLVLISRHKFIGDVPVQKYGIKNRIVGAVSILLLGKDFPEINSRSRPCTTGVDADNDLTSQGSERDESSGDNSLCSGGAKYTVPASMTVLPVQNIGLAASIFKNTETSDPSLLGSAPSFSKYQGHELASKNRNDLNEDNTLIAEKNDFICEDKGDRCTATSAVSSDGRSESSQSYQLNFAEQYKSTACIQSSQHLSSSDGDDVQFVCVEELGSTSSKSCSPNPHPVPEIPMAGKRKRFTRKLKSGKNGKFKSKQSRKIIQETNVPTRDPYPSHLRSATTLKGNSMLHPALDIKNNTIQDMDLEENPECELESSVSEINVHQSHVVCQSESIELLPHKIETARLDPLFICQVCSGQLDKYDDVVTHAQSHSSHQCITCPLCLKVFRQSQMQSFYKHARKHFGKTVQVAENMGYNTDQLSTLSPSENCLGLNGNVLESAANNLYVEQDADKTCDSSENSCGFCWKILSTYQDISYHAKLHSPKESRCPVCMILFSQKGSMRRHVATHVQNVLFMCHLCSAIFTRKDNLKRHQKKHDTQSKSSKHIKVSKLYKKKAWKYRKEQTENISMTDRLNDGTESTPEIPTIDLTIPISENDSCLTARDVSIIDAIAKEVMQPLLNASTFMENETREKQTIDNADLVSSNTTYTVSLSPPSHSDESSYLAVEVENDTSKNNSFLNSTRRPILPTPTSHQLLKPEHSCSPVPYTGIEGELRFFSAQPISKEQIAAKTLSQKGLDETIIESEEVNTPVTYNMYSESLSTKVSSPMSDNNGCYTSLADSGSMKRNVDPQNHKEWKEKSKDFNTLHFLESNESFELQVKSEENYQDTEYFPEIENENPSKDLESNSAPASNMCGINRNRSSQSAWKCNQINTKESLSPDSSMSSSAKDHSMKQEPIDNVDDTVHMYADMTEEVGVCEMMDGTNQHHLLYSDTPSISQVNYSSNGPFESTGWNTYISDSPTNMHNWNSKPVKVFPPRGQDIKCSFCGLALKTVLEITKHMDCHPDVQIPGLHICPVCEVSFQARSSLHRHAANHVGLSFSCYICCESFSRKDNLKRHLKLHENKAFTPKYRKTSK